MKTKRRIAVKDFTVEAKDGSRFELKKGQNYLTSRVRKPDQTVMVFSTYWVRMPRVLFVNDRRKTTLTERRSIPEPKYIRPA